MTKGTLLIGLWLDNEKPNYDAFMSKCVEAVLDAIKSPSLKILGIINSF